MLATYFPFSLNSTLLICALAMYSLITIAAPSAPSTNPDPKQKLEVTNGYVHSWLSFPKVQAKNLLSQRDETIEAVRGVPVVLFFLSSWCLDCSPLIKPFQEVRKKHETGNGVKFYFVFSHDQQDDMLAFYKSRLKEGTAIIANQKVLEQFNNPELPSLYLSDRDTWQYWRKLKADVKSVTELDQILTKMMSY